MYVSSVQPQSLQCYRRAAMWVQPTLQRTFYRKQQVREHVDPAFVAVTAEFGAAGL